MISIHPATLNDAIAISRIVYANCSEAFGVDSNADRIGRWVKKWYSIPAVVQRINDDEYIVIVAKISGQVVGTGYIKNDGYIGGVYVDDRSKGVGRKLLEHLVSKGESLGVSQLVTETHATNKTAVYGAKLFGFKEERVYTDDEYFPDTPFAVFVKSL